ncbi:MAG: hypothetical protein FJX61_00805 [Alphaproteobacteria bacterium]|nr:hypothetical protein [Alphaproteobacteria bacterium]
MASWADLRREAAAWAANGASAALWLRDDDAVRATPALKALLAATARHRIPVALAVVPAACRDDLVGLAAAYDAQILVHGYAHANHAVRPERKSEFGGYRSMNAMVAEAMAGLSRLRALFGAAALPVFVPPWNRADPGLVARLGDAGYRGYSALGDPLPARVAPGLHQANVHVDLIDWRRRTFAGVAATLERLIAELKARRSGGSASRAPIGILTHHLVHDTALERFLDRFLAETAAFPGLRWHSAASVFAPAP